MNKKLFRTHNALKTPKFSDGRMPFHPILMMHAAHMAGYTYEQFMRDHHILVESNMKCLELYDHDAVSVISDPFRETCAFGADIHFAGNASPSVNHIVRSLEDTLQLKCPDIYACERTFDRIQGVELFRRELGADFPVIGWVEGPLAEASDLMGMSEMMMEMMLNPEHIHILVEKTLQTAKDFAAAQIKAGANIIGVGDAVCSQISTELFIEFAFEAHKELFKFIHEQGALVKLHICGNITHLLPYLAQEDIDILDIDWMVDMKEAYIQMGAEIMLCGNFDPVSVIMSGTKEIIKQKFDELSQSSFHGE